MKRVLFFVIFFSLGFQGAATEAAGPAGPERQVFELLNQERARAGLPRLEWDEQVADAARAHAVLMAQTGRVSHRIAGESDVFERLAQSGARFTFSGENVALARGPAEAHRAFMRSPEHRSNILNADYNAIGIGVIARQGRSYVVEDFVHAVPVYSESQFIEAVATAFNRARAARGIRIVEARTDALLRDAACSPEGSATKSLTTLWRGSEIAVFTLSDPGDVTGRLAQEVSNAALREMKIGVCFRPDRTHGPANFWVAAAFSR